MSTTTADTVSGRGARRYAQGALSTTLRNVIKSPRGIQTLVVLTDMVMLALAWAAYHNVRSGLFSNSPGIPPLPLFLLNTSLVVLFWLALFWFSGVYISVHNRSLFDEYYAALKVVGVGIVIISIVFYFTAYDQRSDAKMDIVRLLVSLAIHFLLVAGLIGAGRYLVRMAVRRLRRRGIGLRRTLIVGDSPKSRQLLEMFNAHPELGYAVIGTMGTVGPVTPEFAKRSLGEIEDIDMVIRSRRIEVTVLGMEHQRELVPKLLTETAVADTTIKIIPDLYDIVSGQAKAQHLYGIPLIEINPQIMPVWEQHLKRAMDIACSVFGLVVGAPIWIVAALAVKLEDRGPILYSQERVGLAGRSFMIHKFRSMRTDAESKGISWTAANDPRVTRIGRFMRKTHIDELPQLWNVLIGEMSLVGPRPERPFYVEKYSKILPSYPRRLRVKPGLTGWNQVQLEDMIENVEFVQERLRHDFFYIENLSLRLDIEIIFRTIIRILQRKGQA